MFKPKNKQDKNLVKQHMKSVLQDIQARVDQDKKASYDMLISNLDSDFGKGGTGGTGNTGGQVDAGKLTGKDKTNYMRLKFKLIQSVKQ